MRRFCMARALGARAAVTGPSQPLKISTQHQSRWGAPEMQFRVSDKSASHWPLWALVHLLPRSQYLGRMEAPPHLAVQWWACSGTGWGVAVPLCKGWRGVTDRVCLRWRVLYQGHRAGSLCLQEDAGRTTLPGVRRSQHPPQVGAQPAGSFLRHNVGDAPVLPGWTPRRKQLGSKPQTAHEQGTSPPG